MLLLQAGKGGAGRSIVHLSEQKGFFVEQWETVQCAKSQQYLRAPGMRSPDSAFVMGLPG